MELCSQLGWIESKIICHQEETYDIPVEGKKIGKLCEMCKVYKKIINSIYRVTDK